MQIHELETPALLIDLDIMERNLREASEYTRNHGLRLRPHTKTHKIPALGRRQLELGAAGLTVAKVGEAEVMLRAEPRDLLVAYPIVGRSKLQRLMEVARKAEVTVTLDSAEAARQLSSAAAEAGLTIGVLVEVDVGFGRVGIAPQAVPELAEFIRKLPHLSFQGISFFPGHILRLGEAADQALSELGSMITWIVGELERAGMPPSIVSGGSTPTLFLSHPVPGLNEIRAGTYIFNDRNTVNCGACGLEDCAASVLVTVVSCAAPERIIVDGGSKTFSSDLPLYETRVSFGHVVETPEALFYRMNEEHGYLDTREARRSLAVGDRLRIIPNHICPAVNLHEVAYGVRGTAVEEVWAIEGRAKLT